MGSKYLEGCQESGNVLETTDLIVSSPRLVGYGLRQRISVPRQR